MRRFLLFVVVSCIAALAVRSLWPSQLADYLALFHQHTSVNSGVVVTALGLLALLLTALRVRRRRLERELDRLRRELDRLRRGLAPPVVPAPPPVPPVVAAYPPAPSAPWEPSAWR
jgi:heme exporter protein D